MSSKSYSLRIADIIGVSYLAKSRHYKSRFAVTSGNFVVCAMCCHSFRERFALLDTWKIIDCKINRIDRNLSCKVCETKIPATDPIKIQNCFT